MRIPYLIVFLLLASCGSEDTVRIGSVLSLTGPISELGEGTQQAMELAARDINAQGGIHGASLEIVYEDGKCQPREAVTAAQKLIETDMLDILIGSLCSDETLAIAPLAEQAGVVVLSPCSSNAKITHAGDYIFRNYPADIHQGRFAAEYAYHDLSARRVAVLAIDNDYGRGLADMFSARFAELGGEIVWRGHFDQEATDMRSQLLDIETAGVDLIFMPARSNTAALILRQKRELDLDVPALSGDGAHDPSVPALAGGVAEGFMVVSVSDDIDPSFLERYRSAFGEDPTTCAPQGYDAVTVIAEVIRDVGTDPGLVKEALYEVNATGVSGPIAFDENGDLIGASYKVYTVKDGIFESS